MWRTRSKYAQVIHIFATYLTIGVRSILAGEPLRRIARRRSLVLLAGLLLFINMPNASAINTPRDINNYKLYAHMKLGNDKQYRCLVTLWRLESNWSPTADNKHSTAFGIPQLLKMKETNPYKQIDLGLKYINTHKLYTGDVCKALDRHKRVGHY